MLPIGNKKRSNKNFRFLSHDPHYLHNPMLSVKSPVAVTLVTTLEKLAHPLPRGKKNISGMWRQRPNALELPVILGLTTMSLTSTMRRTSTKEIPASENFYSLGTPLWRLTRIITLATLFNKNSLSPFIPNFTLLICFNFLSHYIFSKFLLHLFALWRPQFYSSKAWNS